MGKLERVIPVFFVSFGLHLGYGHVLHQWLFALRAVFNVNVRQCAVNGGQCFLGVLWRSGR